MNFDIDRVRRLAAQASFNLSRARFAQRMLTNMLGM